MTESAEQREENIHDKRDENIMKTDDLKTIDDRSSKRRNQNEGKAIYQVKIGLKPNLGGKNDSNIGAKEGDMKRFTKIRTGREKEILCETWKWIINEFETRTVDASKMVKRASKEHAFKS